MSAEVTQAHSNQPKAHIGGQENVPRSKLVLLDQALIHENDINPGPRNAQLGYRDASVVAGASSAMPVDEARSRTFVNSASHWCPQSSKGRASYTYQERLECEESTTLT